MDKKLSEEKNKNIQLTTNLKELVKKNKEYEISYYYLYNQYNEMIKNFNKIKNKNTEYELNIKDINQKYSKLNEIYEKLIRPQSPIKIKNIYYLFFMIY